MLDIKEFCTHHKPKMFPNYLSRLEWCDNQAKKGLKQTYCDKCHKWLFPSEIGVKKPSS